MENQKWPFSKYSEGEVGSDSSSHKHVGDLTTSQSLIRELIQNSLDAIDREQKIVEIKISFKEIDYNSCKKYLEGLRPHYQACKGYGQFPKKEKVQFLILEDFNTQGLTGNKKDDFLFNDNIKSGDNEKSGGSHGIGKAVFSLSSEIRTFFAFSVFKEDIIFYGLANFQTHKIDEKKIP